MPSQPPLRCTRSHPGLLGPPSTRDLLGPPLTRPITGELPEDASKIPVDAEGHCTSETAYAISQIAAIPEVETQHQLAFRLAMEELSRILVISTTSLSRSQAGPFTQIFRHLDQVLTGIAVLFEGQLVYRLDVVGFKFVIDLLTEKANEARNSLRSNGLENDFEILAVHWRQNVTSFLGILLRHHNFQTGKQIPKNLKGRRHESAGPIKETDHKEELEVEQARAVETPNVSTNQDLEGTQRLTWAKEMDLQDSKNEEANILSQLNLSAMSIGAPSNPKTQQPSFQRLQARQQEMGDGPVKAVNSMFGRPSGLASTPRYSELSSIPEFGRESDKAERRRDLQVTSTPQFRIAEESGREFRDFDSNDRPKSTTFHPMTPPSPLKSRPLRPHNPAPSGLALDHNGSLTRKEQKAGSNVSNSDSVVRLRHKGQRDRIRRDYGRRDALRLYEDPNCRLRNLDGGPPGDPSDDDNNNGNDGCQPPRRPDGFGRRRGPPGNGPLQGPTS
ncbi:hypothetical protein SISSUDRAFT_1101906 [Sistotremastrum suecicum HHB10207 ss-3]|uniref:Uncharacterized protein n=1 Tax=Sistotremastrum suecicum HHB10207 ss-3 TaxID=1314776 RepID=A0A165WRB3_9AGAM|nr:hypothetical protein SISSUDRAFT_1101906 [Sistotremastrum suecicum HHB10207 ss-3]